MLTRSQAREDRARATAASRPGPRPGHQLPIWPSVLAVVAHPDDETFGLGGIIGKLTGAGAAVHILCFTHGEASTLNETGADLHAIRETELRQASAELGAASVTLLGYPDGQLARSATGLAGHVRDLIAAHNPHGLLVFDETGITGHADHQAATQAAVNAATQADLPVLAWALPATVASQLRQETGQPFTGQPPDRLDLCVRVDRGAQRRTALVHATQISPAAVLWRRLQLLGDCEHLRWLRRPRPASRPHRLDRPC
jgi:LmbE family N-acetylglucosaminyl deacetylase